MIREDQVEAALTYLQSTDESCAHLKATMKGLDNQKKTIHAIQVLKHDGAIGLREKIAYASQAYIDHLEKCQDAVFEYEIENNRRNTSILLIETWRSMNANQRRGNIT